MKKLILTALLALASLLPAQALEKGVCGFDSPEAMDGNTFAPSSACNAYSRSQSIYTKDQLQGLYNVTSDGITKAKISKITFLVKDETGGHIFMNGETFKTTAYIQNTELEAIPEENGKYLYTDYSQSVTGSVSVDGNTDDEWGSFTMMGGGVLKVTIDLDEPLVYEGKSLLLTWIGESEFVESSNWGDGTVGALTDHYATIYEANDNSAYTNVSGSVSSAAVHKYIPALKFTYEEEVEKLGPTVTEGMADVFTTPSYDSPEIGSQSSGQILPHDPENYTNSFCQTLYTASDLKGLNKMTEAGEEVKAKITSFTFKMSAEDYYSGSFSSVIYIQNSEADDFPVKDGKKQWFDDYKSGVMVQFQTDEYEGLETYEPIEFTVTLDKDAPFIYEGGSIVITWISEGKLTSMMGAGLLSQVFNSDTGHSCVISTDKDLSNTSGAIQKIGYAQPYLSSYLPVLKIDYVPLTYSGGETKTQIKLANAQLGVAKAADRTGKAGNNVYMKFDIEDAADCGTYDLYLGANNKVGSITGTHGIVNFLVKTDTKGNLVDQIMTVKPQTANSSVIDGEMTIAADDIAALFKAPVVTETVGTVVYTSYYYTTSTAELRGAAAVKMTASDNAVTAISLGSGLTIMYQGNGSTGYYDAFEPLIPASATSWEISRDPAQNDGVISFYKTGSVASIPVIRREPQIDQLNGLISIKPTAEYVCLKGATVTADAPAIVSTTTDSYSLKLQAAEDYRVRFTPGSELVAEIELPGGEEKIVMEEDEEYLMFYTTQGATLQYRLEPTVAAQPGINALAEDAADSSYDNSHEWTTAEKGYINLNLQENKGNKVFVRTVDTKGNARLTAYREIKADGTTSGVADIEADAAAGAEYFNLQGIRVSGELTPGIYIRRQGTTATKVTVK